MSSPFISILIPSYNRPEYLTSTIASVLDQHGCNFEVIVSDDASPRRTEIEAALGQFNADPRFRYIPQPRNLGWSDNRNSLVAHARGEFVMLLGDDDILPNDALARLSAHLQATPGSDIVAFGYQVITPEGKHAYSRRVPRGLELSVGDQGQWKEVFYYDILPMWGFHPFTYCCRRALPVQFPYDKRCGIGDDVFFLFQVLDAGFRVEVLPDVLFQWRRSLRPVKGYVNLSSSATAQDNARWAIWHLSQVTPWTHREVRELVGSPTFAQHFLRLRSEPAERIAQLGRTGSTVALVAAQDLWKKLGPSDRWQDSKLSKLTRMHALGGIQYSWFGFSSTIRALRNPYLTLA